MKVESFELVREGYRTKIVYKLKVKLQTEKPED